MRQGAERGSRKWVALALLCVAQFVNVLGVTVVVVALPSIGRSLQLSGAALHWVASSYALVFGALLMVCGRAADRHGRRRQFTLGLAVFGVASLTCGLAGTGRALILARGAQGLGAALGMPAALSMLTVIFPEGAERDRAVGVWTAVAAGGGAAGFFLGGLMTEALGWRWVFLLNVPVCVIGVMLARLLLEESRGEPDSGLDVAGSATITAGLVSLMFGLTRAEQVGFADASTLIALVSACGLIAGSVLIEVRARDPLLPLALLRVGDVSGSAVAAFTLTATTSGAAVIGTLYLQDVLGYSASITGLVYVPFSLAVVAGSAIGAWLPGRIGQRRTIASGMVAVGVAMAVASGISADAGLTDLLVALIVAGGGLGCASVAATSAGVSAVADWQRGLVSGLLNAAAQVGTAVGIAVLLAVAATRAGTRGPTPQVLVDGYRTAYVVATGAAALGLLSALSLIGRRDRDRAPSRRGRDSVAQRL